jgi:hypothetical protein
VLLGLLLFRPLLGDLGGTILADDLFTRPGQSDAYNFLWGYWWTQKAVSLGTSPLHCSWVLPPGGADLRFHTLPLLPALLTYPLGRLAGTVPAYNLTVIGLIVAGAGSMQWLARRGFGLARLPAWAAGALFGFAPYFVFKAHAHLHLVGAAFWATALGQLIVAYRTGDFRPIRGIAFALSLWATFWASLVEFTMLVPFATIVALVGELGGRRPGPARRALFFLPAGAGALSLLPLLAGGTEHVSVPLYGALRPAQLFSPPALSLLSRHLPSDPPEFLGTYLPLALLLPAAAGLALAVRDRRREFVLPACGAVAALGLSLDPLGLASSALRALPLGGGFRVLGRFFPFLLFFLAPLAGLGLQGLRQALPTPAFARLAAAGLALLALLESFPARMRPSRVASMTLPRQVAAAVDRDAFVFVVPRREYRTVHDTWQVALDMRAVRLSFVGREPALPRNLRQRLFPILHANERIGLDDPETRDELRRARVGYLLFEDPRTPRPSYGSEVWRSGAASLWAVADAR